MFFALAKKELQALSRDVHGLAALFLMPMVFIIVMSMALKDVYTPRCKRCATPSSIRTAVRKPRRCCRPGPRTTAPP